MDKKGKKVLRSEERKYYNNYLLELNVLNAGRLAIAFTLIFTLEIFVTAIRIKDGKLFADTTLSVISIMKLITSSAYLGYYFYCKRTKKHLPVNFRHIVYASLILLAIIQSYLLYDEIVTVHTIYNHLYYLLILAWAMIYPPRNIFPLFGLVTVASYVILFGFSDSSITVGDNFFALTVFSTISPIASYVIYRNHFTGFINKEKLNQVTILDYLTKIYNRRGFYQQVDMLRQAYSQKNRVAAIMIDIDSFKLYNDNYGHDAGDKCLEAIGAIFPKILYQSSEVYARFGGEEFAVALFGHSKKEVKDIAEQICRGVENLKISHEYSRSGKYVTISVGAYCSRVTSDFSIEELLKKADQYLYEAKANGGNQVICSVKEY